MHFSMSCLLVIGHNMKILYITTFYYNRAMIASKILHLKNHVKSQCKTIKRVSTLLWCSINITSSSLNKLLTIAQKYAHLLHNFNSAHISLRVCNCLHFS